MVKLIVLLLCFFLIFCEDVEAKKIYWDMPQDYSQQKFANDEYECVNSVKVVSQPQSNSQQQAVIIQQNNQHGDNQVIYNSGQKSFLGSASQSLSQSLSNTPKVYVDPELFKLCMRSKGYVESEKPLTEKQLKAAQISTELNQDKILNEFEKISSENRIKSQAALEEFKSKPGVISYASGIYYKEIEHGSGVKPNVNSLIEFNFSGSLVTSGKEFVNTFRDKKPVTGRIMDIVKIPGMLDVMLQMPMGSRWHVMLPSEKAWGNDIQSVRGGPGPNQAIFLDIQLISVK